MPSQLWTSGFRDSSIYSHFIISPGLSVLLRSLLRYFPESLIVRCVLHSRDSATMREYLDWVGVGKAQSAGGYTLAGSTLMLMVYTYDLADAIYKGLAFP
jgi:hypothetical protein